MEGNREISGVKFGNAFYSYQFCIKDEAVDDTGDIIHSLFHLTRTS